MSQIRTDTALFPIDNSDAEACAPMWSAQRTLQQELVIDPSAGLFASMRAAFHASGGILRAADLARLMKQRDQDAHLHLAQRLAAGELFGVQWHGVYWVPLVQFALADLSMKPAPCAALAEMSKSLDSWTLALWLVQPNPDLDGRRPVDMLTFHDAEVLTAFARLRPTEGAAC